MTITVPRLRRMSLPVTAALVALGPVGAYAAPRPGLPVAQAFEGDKPLPSTRPAIEQCAAHPDGCHFHIDTALSGEYYSAVRSLGNAMINCTKDPITVTRQVTLKTGSTDNLGGEITGKLAVEGQINASGEVTATVHAEGSGDFTTPNKQQGPSATVGAKAGANGGGKLAGALGVKGAFEGAFKLTYQHTWTTEVTEATTSTTMVQPGDALVFGASSAMRRIAGTLNVGGLQVRNIVVDGPSTVNTSTFIADTFTAPGNACDRLRTRGRTAVDDTINNSSARMSGLVRISALPAGARLTHRTVLTPERY
ncbi:hypothetical protein GCM10023195_01650 [Actinoallomurus liliacearum]|uniref:DUF5666 domain-containing protein n=1 Tax=Actinoallomurus liliacearum TaxID=1080073 RepID=A0ABP8TBE6_9ACTN